MARCKASETGGIGATVAACVFVGGVTVEQAIGALGERISDLQQASASNASGAEVKRQAYLNWVNTTQVHLRTIFSDAELEDTLLARGYWRICQMSSQSAERLLNRLIGEELVFQVGHPGILGDSGGRLGEVITTLRALTGLAAWPGRICVLDTNALLHYTRFDQLPWPERLRQELVRLVIPLAVVDELDGKKVRAAGRVPAAGARAPDADRRLRDSLTTSRLLDGPRWRHVRGTAGRAGSQPYAQ